MPSLRRSLLLSTLVVLLADELVIPLRASAYPSLTANSDAVIVAPYDSAVSGAGNIADGDSYRYFLTLGQRYRVRQNGTITQVEVYIADAATDFRIDIWRKNGTTYDLVGESENLADSLSVGVINTVSLSTSISGVQEGDYYGYRLDGDGNPLYSRSGVSGVTMYYVTGSTPSATGYNWEAQASLAGVVVPIELYMQAPQVVFIGDSIIAGHPNHYSFIETSATTNLASTIEKQFGDLTSYTYQNMGIGSQTTSQIAARFTTDVVDLKPRVAVVEGGVNDIGQGGAKSTFLANWTAMLDAAQDAGITMVILKILPWTNGTNSQMQTRDDWNASLASLASGYTNAVVVDASSYVGQYRPSGSGGNLWDIQTAYNADGVHFNQAGHGQIAQALADTFATLPPLISTLSPAENATSVALNANLSVTFSSPVIPQAGVSNDIIIRKSSDDSIVETIDAQSAQVTGSGTETITINPSSNLAIATRYYVQIGADAFDDATGNSFAGISDTTTWSFRTVDSIEGYAYRKAITIDNANVDATLTDFPLYVRIAADTDIGVGARSDGYDLRFTTSTGMILPYAREDFHVRSGSGSGDFWVEVPRISSTADTTIYLYYGKSNAEDGEDALGTWNSDFAGIWHLDEDVTDEGTSTAAHLDSTSNAHNGTQNGNARTAGMISYGQAFDGVDDDITISSSYASNNITLSWWSNCPISAPTAQGIFDIYRGTSGDRLYGYHWDHDTNGVYIVYYDASSGTSYKRVLNTSITQSDWHHYSAVWNEAAKTFAIYRDGVAQTTEGTGSPNTPTGTTTRLGVGYGSAFGNVTMDEVRISSVASPADWIKFDYENTAQADHELTWEGQEVLTTTTSRHGAAAANAARERWWQEYEQELQRQASATT
ncbi:MAG: DUF2341 domain-containing protein [Candidatus Peribacteraceae bacterium]|nr:DUF2341 domain-containing protein [Candidatus Peribacteraceae bacterium]MDD5742324.1 DUF2341 domain-containing protein [Candidatus Peribacteraceae bacterium]